MILAFFSRSIERSTIQYSICCITGEFGMMHSATVTGLLLFCFHDSVRKICSKVCRTYRYSVLCLYDGIWIVFGLVLFNSLVGEASLLGLVFA